MLNLDPGKLLVIGVVAIILLGPDRLPQVARQLGGAWRSFNEFRHRMESEVRNTMPDLPPTSEIARLARSPSALLNHLSTMSSDSEGEPDGSFQPPDRAHENGAAGAAEAAAPAAGHPTGESAGGADLHALPSQEPAPMPMNVDRPPRAPQPSGVVVPGDPTLN
jgi:sec-independent protein translocase protein TatB